MRMLVNEAIASAVAPVSLMSQTSARIAFAGGLVSLLLLAALHVLKPNLDPSLHVVSEYALGDYGWVMALCFLSLAIGCASLFVALLSDVGTVGGRIGLAFLLAAAVGLVMAAIYPMDPITVAPQDASTSGRMHGVAGMIGIPSLVIAAVVLSYALRTKPLWAPVSGPMLALGHLNWISLVLMFGLLAIAMKQGTAGLGGLIGWANRLLMIAYGGWVMIAAWPLARIGRP